MRKSQDRLGKKLKGRCYSTGKEILPVLPDADHIQTSPIPQYPTAEVVS